jgi:hypothetical protein
MTMNLMANHFLDGCALTDQTNDPSSNTTDEEYNEQPEETTMVLWDVNHMMPRGKPH